MPHGLARLRLDTATKIIKVDVLNYALQTGAGVNTTAVTPTELLAQQNKIIAACHRRRSGLPRAITDSTSVPFNGDDVLLLIRPSTLQLVRVTRRHIVDYRTAARSERPVDLYVAQEAPLPSAAKRPRAGALPPSQPFRSSGAGHGGEPVTRVDGSASESGAMVSSSSSEDENIHDIQHLHRPLGKRRCVNHEDTGSDEGISSDQDERACSWDRKNRGVVFHPSPTDRRPQGAIVQPLHAGKDTQMLLQSVQQSEYVDLPPLPCFVVADEEAATESREDMWDFSSRNSLTAPPRVTKVADLTNALSSFYRFVKYFYNKAPGKFIGATRDFFISYADSASTMARLVVH
ncbi:hypothetical protein PPTG_17230 [Phytophthora nicotianae INRA-310]|uniref:Uncharacterized protein n=1 Tax=Phytophthora nicotianae (strain INRA-310) TaxID=761204 RepID=W2PKX2_PHYN3|nr:hypothetical protein PPTG_17230 [Phytophthora nicotianae INRA-310]ETN01507.1 hypothetical protein PPTG_17230 [Phytophthora nicotianae INRA-310]